MSSEDKWKPISLTYVEYIEGDYLGYLLAWSSMLPLFLLASLCTLMLFRRDLHTIFFLMGFLLNEALNYVLKHSIKEARPMRRATHFVEYGMPSSHAQFMSFFATYMACFVYIRIHHNSSWVDNMWKHLSYLACFFASVVVCISRVYLKYHTTSQVLCGTLVGVLTGSLWFYLVHFVFTNFFPAICLWTVSEYLMIRDMTPIPNVLWFEYCSYRAEARTRQRKSNSSKKM